jgi:hypothetical protein
MNPSSKSYVNVTIDSSIPNNIHEALKSNEANKWEEAIKSELESLTSNNVWEVVEKKNQKVIGTRWVFKIKKDSSGTISKFKARLVAKGYNQKYGIDYNETFAPVVKIQSLRVVLAIAANLSMEVHQIDIDTAFLNGILSEEVYIESPPGCDICNKNQVCKLNRALYGLKQAPYEWNKTLVKFLCDFGLRQLKSDMCIFVNTNLIIAVYVDDICIASKNIKHIIEFKEAISLEFKIKDLGFVNFVLGIKIDIIKNGNWILHQKIYIDSLIDF